MTPIQPMHRGEKVDSRKPQKLRGHDLSIIDGTGDIEWHINTTKPGDTVTPPNAMPASNGIIPVPPMLQITARTG